METRRERYNSHQQKYQRRMKALLRRYKTLKGCADCGYREHHAALEFDHLPGYDKSGTRMARGSGISRKRIKAELQKCEVVCRNCHGIRTWERQQ